MDSYEIPNRNVIKISGVHACPTSSGSQHACRKINQYKRSVVAIDNRHRATTKLLGHLVNPIRGQ